MSAREHSSANRAGTPKRRFRAGDRVRVLPGEGTGRFDAGDEFTVVAVGGSGHLQLDPEPDPPQSMWLPDRFELVDEPAPEPTEWTPGDGWREVPSENSARDHEEYRAHWTGTRWAYWVREEPVPPLPTEPYTVIRVTWRDAQAAPREGITSSQLTLSEYGSWYNRMLDVQHDDLPHRLAGFEVLAAPRSVTAAAVVEFVQQALSERRIRAEGLQDVLSNARHEFGAAL